MSYNGQLNFGLVVRLRRAPRRRGPGRRAAAVDRRAGRRRRGQWQRRSPRRARAPRAPAPSPLPSEADNCSRARGDRGRLARAVGRADRAAVRLLRRTRPGRRVRHRHRSWAPSSATRATPTCNPGQPHPAYDSNPPTSGAHVPEPVTHDMAELNNDQLLQALEEGNVVVMYGTRNPPPGLEAFAHAGGGAVHAGAGRGRPGGDPRAPPRDQRLGRPGLGAPGLGQRRGRPAAEVVHAILARERRLPRLPGAPRATAASG